ncbi:MAG: hypothetical protein WCT24_02680 [Patescibacteria group bacterium]
MRRNRVHFTEWIREILFIPAVILIVLIPGVGLMIFTALVDALVQVAPILWWVSVATLAVLIETRLMRQRRAELIRQVAEK